MGHYGLWFDFTNQGDTCTLAGYPQILGLNAAGAWEPAPARQTIDSYIPAAPSIGPLARGESATVLLQGSNSAFYPNTECPTGPKSPPSYQKVAFVLPGDATRLEVDTNVSGMCELAISTFGSPRR